MYGNRFLRNEPEPPLHSVQDEQQRPRHRHVLVKNVAEFCGHEKRLSRAASNLQHGSAGVDFAAPYARVAARKHGVGEFSALRIMHLRTTQCPVRGSLYPRRVSDIRPMIPSRMHACHTALSVCRTISATKT